MQRDFEYKTCRISIRLTNEKIDVNDAINFSSNTTSGAHSFFVGTTRGYEQINDVKIPIKGLYYDCYSDMAIGLLEDISKETVDKFDGLSSILICHRTGFVPTAEASILVVCSGGHRGSPFKAVEFSVNQVKAKVPIWKKFLPEKDGHEEDWLTRNSEAFWLQTRE